MRVADRIESKLREALAPTELEIHDDSHLHEGHSGWRVGGETHFRVRIVSSQFAGHGRVARQRMVYDAIANELTDRVHALQVTAQTPEET